MKRITIALLLILPAYLSFAQIRSLDKRKHSVNKVIKQVESSPVFKTAGFAFLAVDLNSGQTIAQHNSYMALKPASTQKLFSTATMLELAGPDYRFETKIKYRGKIDQNEKLLRGDIIIEGGGDPTLGSKYFDETKTHAFLNDWLNAIKSAGIDSITGGIIADARIYSNEVPPGWSWSDMGNYYGAGACGLTIFDNYYSLYFNTGNPGDTAIISKVSPAIPGLQFDNTVTAATISYDNSYIFGAPQCYSRYIRGQLPAQKINFEVKGSLPDPALMAACQLDSILKKHDVGIGQSPTTMKLNPEKANANNTANKILYITYSPTLFEIIQETNVHSINLFAEHCLIQAGLDLGAEPETGSAADSLVSYWDVKGIDTRGMQLFDGSGLSHYNAISPRQIVSLLSYMKNESEYFEAYYQSMAVAGESGTLKNILKGTVAQGKLRAKSGTVNKVKAYAGYVTSASGREIAFSMVVNNFSGSSADARKNLEQLMVALAEFKK